MTCVLRDNGRDVIHQRGDIASWLSLGLIHYCEGCSEEARYTFEVYHVDDDEQDVGICESCDAPFPTHDETICPSCAQEDDRATPLPKAG